MIKQTKEEKKRIADAKVQDARQNSVAIKFSTSKKMRLCLRSLRCYCRAQKELKRLEVQAKHRKHAIENTKKVANAALTVSQICEMEMKGEIHLSSSSICQGSVNSKHINHRKAECEKVRHERRQIMKSRRESILQMRREQRKEENEMLANREIILLEKEKRAKEEVKKQNEKLKREMQEKMKKQIRIAKEHYKVLIMKKFGLKPWLAYIHNVRENHEKVIIFFVLL